MHPQNVIKFFLDTANLNEIREANALGVIDGVTTNPSLVAKEGGVDFKQQVAAICDTKVLADNAFAKNNIIFIANVT